MKPSSALQLFLYLAFVCFAAVSIGSTSPPEQNLTSTSSNDTAFLINTPTCKVPSVPVFDSDIFNIFTPYKTKEYQCWNSSVSVFTRIKEFFFGRNPIQAIRRVNYTFIEIPPGLEDCSAEELAMSPDDEEEYEMLDLGPLDLEASRIVEFIDIDHVLIKCDKGEKVVPLIPKKEPRHWPDVAGPKTKPTHQPNVLLIGLDSLSRLNFLRHFNQTTAFLNTHSFQPFLGHHKIGLNTDPNVFAMMLGLNYSTIEQMAAPQSGKLDNLSFITKEYSNAGYITSYTEDYVPYGLFNYNFEGFAGPRPMEYTTRAVNLYINQRMADGEEVEPCYGEALEMEYYWSLILDQMSAFKSRHQPFLIWTHFAQLLHDDLNEAQYIDLPLHRFLTALFSAGHQKDTIILLYSDHAYRRFELEEALVKSMYQEVRTPVLYIRVPEEGALQLTDETGETIDSSKVMEIMKINSHRLTSHYDIYSTLQHILYGRPITHPVGRSLFTPLPLNRTCAQAGIPAQFCLCASPNMTNIAVNSTLAVSLGEQLIEDINEYIATSKYTAKCHRMSLNKVLDVRAIVGQDVHGSPLTDDMINQTVLFSVLFTAAPTGLFEAAVKTTVVMNGSANDTEVLGSMERKDTYRYTGHCVHNRSTVERFCICKEMSENATKVKIDKAGRGVGGWGVHLLNGIANWFMKMLLKFN